MNLTRNNNEGVIKRLANSSLKANRSRNIPIIATIAIALCLVTFFLLLPLNIQKRTQNELDGRFQASVYNVSEDEISALKAEIGDENVGFYADLGTIQTAEYTLNIAY